MRKIVLILLSLIAYSGTAQISFNTGSVHLDSDLNIINTSASADFGSFKADMGVSFNVSERKIEYMRMSLNMAPGEIYFALEISRLSKTPIDTVITVYKKSKGKGWGYIAKEAGIKPGSSEFHQLKNNASSKKNKGQNKGKGQGKPKVKEKVRKKK